MTDSNLPETIPPDAARTPYPPYRPSPFLIIFLIMPILASVVALLITNTGPDASQAGENEPPAVGFTPFSLIDTPAPAFALQTPNGDPVTLDGYRGRWLVVNFWATWCAPCRVEMPAFQALADGRLTGGVPSAAVALLAVNRGEDAATVSAYLDELALNIPVGLDVSSEVSTQYGAIQLPMTYFIDPAGIVRYRHIGALSEDLLMRYLERMKP